MDLYAILGVSRDASQQEIKDAYRNLAKKYHPDKHTGLSEPEIAQMNEEFGKITKAYNVLSDSSARKLYDRTGSSDTADDTYKKAYQWVYSKINTIVKSYNTMTLRQYDIIKTMKSEVRETIEKMDHDVSIARNEMIKVNEAKNRTRVKNERKNDEQILMVYEDLKQELVAIIHDRLQQKIILQESMNILENMEYKV